jgi:hypothetical protein
MPMLKMAVAIAFIVFGAVAIFMGLFVTIGAMSAGEIAYSAGEGAAKVITRYRQADAPDDFWRAVGLLGVLPLVLGGLGIWFGRRQFRS